MVASANNDINLTAAPRLSKLYAIQVQEIVSGPLILNQVQR
jgi:hypothetical protein